MFFNGSFMHFSFSKDHLVLKNHFSLYRDIKLWFFGHYKSFDETKWLTFKWSDGNRYSNKNMPFETGLQYILKHLFGLRPLHADLC